MGRETKRTTISFEPDVHSMLRLKAAESSRSISDLVNQAVIGAFDEEERDIKDLDGCKTEAEISITKMVEQLKRDGAI